jgi:hypothetical protein
MCNQNLIGIEMLYTIFAKEIRRIKDEYSISYYLETHKKEISVIYEFIGLYRYDYRRYNISLNYNIIHEGIVVNNIVRNFEKVYNNIEQSRKLAVIAKFIVYTISKELTIPLYRLITNVTYEANGETIRLSPNAFAKSVYKLSSTFEKILS